MSQPLSHDDPPDARVRTSDDDAETIPPPARSSHARLRASKAQPPPPPPPTVDIEAYLARAMFLLDEGRFELAARHALVCIEAAPLDHRAFLIAAIANESLGRTAVAERLYRRTLAVGPGTVEAEVRLQLLLYR
jgi:Flp pilus assembly protein TadD